MSTTDFKEMASGDNVSFLDCPECDFQGDVYYRTKEPLYCSNACKQRAQRKKKKRHEMTLRRHEILKSLTLDTLDQLPEHDRQKLISHLKRSSKQASLASRMENEAVNKSMALLYRAMHDFVISIG